MKKSYLLVLVFGILFLFFIQVAGTLVESIYILDLMNSKLDEKVLGVLFFFTPLLLLPFYTKRPRPLVWILVGILLLTRGLTPYLNTAGRFLASGLATGAALCLFFLVLAEKPKGETHSRVGLWGSAGLALAVGLSALLRTVSLGLDYSLTPAGGWVGWGLGLALGGLLTQLDRESKPAVQPGGGSVTAPILGPIVGIYLSVTLVYFAFSAPAVIARWTEGNYTYIVAAISLLSTGWVLLALSRPHWIERINTRLLVFWNLLFTICLTGTLLAHRVPFPPTPESPAVVVGAPDGLQQIPLALMLLLFPVIFLDMQVFLDQIQLSSAPHGLVPGILLGSTALVLLIFAHIFTNVWGYIKPVSLPFRNAFWLPYLLLAGGATLLIWRAKRAEPDSEQGSVGTFPWAWTVLLGAIFLGTLVTALPTQRIQVAGTDITSLKVMTFNTQQANDNSGEKSYDRQLALIKRVSPDILSLQELDSTRISLNNNDYVRYYAEKLGYYSYYGPTTVAGTYGTAILSKYPLLNTRTAFTYSDKDEIGVAEAEIEVNGHRLTLYDVHPDGSDTAMLVFAKVLLERSKDKPYVIALGDYNLRDYEEAYKLINSVYTNAWTSVYPSKISADGVDMSGENRIDHIFVSSALGVRNPVYVLVPDSATDHAVHWAEIYWKNP
jgi:endonuclease/exonuclease/phosphatase family metal-dependent hydrolase